MTHNLHPQKIKYALALLILFVSLLSFGQVKIGDDINTIDANSILELESNTKALVITRLTDIEMNALVPLNGAMVYNTDAKCIYVFEGLIWKSLCNSEIMVVSSTTPPTMMGVGDIWINETNNKVFVWDGTAWIPITKNPRSGNGAPNTVSITDTVAGDMYVDTVTGDIYTYNGTDWIDQTINANNGLSETTNKTIELGGNLVKPTEIGTNATNTIAISGLEEVVDNANAIVTVEPTTGILRKSPVSGFVQQEEIVIIANDAQTRFTPPLSITSSKKLNVYRNGVKLGFTVIDNSTIELESPVFCYQNDKIRIVQFY